MTILIYNKNRIERMIRKHLNRLDKIEWLPIGYSKEFQWKPMIY